MEMWEQPQNEGVTKIVGADYQPFVQAGPTRKHFGRAGKCVNLIPRKLLGAKSRQYCCSCGRPMTSVPARPVRYPRPEPLP